MSAAARISSPAAGSAAPKPPVLRTVAGPNRGREIVLHDGVQSVDDRFVVSVKDGVHLARSVTGREIMIGGDLVMESILGPGDVVVTEAGEYEFVTDDAGASGARRFRALLALLAVAVAALFLGPSLAPLLRHLEDPPPAPAADAVLGDEPSVHAKPPPREPESPAALDGKIALARLQFAVADEYARQSVDLGGLYWASQVWKSIETELAGIEPTPDVLVEARSRRTRAEKDLEAAKERMRDNAFIALQAGRRDASAAILEELLAAAQTPSDPAYLWALNQLRVVHGEQPVATGKANP